MGVSNNRGTPKSSHFNRVFHYKPSILGYPYFWKHPYNIYYQTGRVSSITFPATFLQDGSGEIGELWIAGSQVGLGYLRCQRKTTATSTRRFPPKIWGNTFRLGMAKEMRRIRRINIFFWGEDSIF